MQDGRLTHIQIRTLRDLLLNAFVQRDRFAEFLFLRLGKRLGYLTSPATPDDIAYLDVLVNANAEHWWRELLLEARNVRPSDPGLLAFSQKLGLAPAMLAAAPDGKLLPVDEQELQLKIDEASSTFDVARWREHLGTLEGQVCRVEYPAGAARGTAFLVAPDIVMTNYHVIQPIHAKKIPYAEVVLRFDYKVAGDGVTVAPGVTYKLAVDWLADFSPPSALDHQSDPTGDPAYTELDYALLKVDGRPGDDPVGGVTKDHVFTSRSWIKVPAVAHDFAVNPALYILQHPEGEPLKLALDSRAIVKVNGNGTRVRYRTTTQPGSSGSPCFGADWQWVAIHHAGDPKYYDGHKPEFNRGIPLAAIQRLLGERGKLDLLGKGI